MKNVKKLAPVTRTYAYITGEFVSRDMHNIHAAQTAYDWTPEAVAALAESPDATEWLKLADRLEEEGNPAHHMIRAVFQDGYQVPAGFSGYVGRSGNYWESGSKYSEGFSVEWRDKGHEGAGLYHTYWSNGNFIRTISLEEAREMLTTTNYRRAGRWPSVTVSGTVRPAGAVLPAGTKVQVRKSGGLLRGESYRDHETTTQVPVPLTDCCISYEMSNTRQLVSFEHMGYEVVCKLEALDIF